MTAISFNPVIAANPALPPAATGPPAEFPAESLFAIAPALENLFRSGGGDSGGDLPPDGNALPLAPGWPPVVAAGSAPPAPAAAAAVGAGPVAPGAPAGNAVPAAEPAVPTPLAAAAGGPATAPPSPPAASPLTLPAPPADSPAPGAPLAPPARGYGAVPGAAGASSPVRVDTGPGAAGGARDEPAQQFEVAPQARTVPPSAMARTSLREAAASVPQFRAAAGTDAAGGSGTSTMAAAAAPAPAVEELPIETSGKPPLAVATPAAGVAPALSPPQPAPQAAAMQLPAAVTGERFGDALGERVLWMVDRDLNSARLTLNPPQLGPLEVRVQVSGDQASVSFAAHNYLTRDALEQAIPRLRDMLGAQGFAHVDVNIAHHSFSERSAQPAHYDGFAPLADDPAVSLPALAAGRARSATALLDAYA